MRAAVVLVHAPQMEPLVLTLAASVACCFACSVEPSARRKLFLVVFLAPDLLCSFTRLYQLREIESSAGFRLTREERRPFCRARAGGLSARGRVALSSWRAMTSKSYEKKCEKNRIRGPAIFSALAAQKGTRPQVSFFFLFFRMFLRFSLRFLPNYVGLENM